MCDDCLTYARRLHVLLAEERGFASCSGEAQAAERESTAMRDALERSFLRIDAEVLNRARAENARDGSCALVAVRIGALTCKHQSALCGCTAGPVVSLWPAMLANPTLPW